MIQAAFVFDSQNRVKAFQMTGHADYAEKGEDIICSAVSAICQTVIGTLTEFLKVGKDMSFTAEEGKIACRINDYDCLTDRVKISAEALMFSSYIGIKQIKLAEGQRYLSIVKVEEDS